MTTVRLDDILLEIGHSIQMAGAAYADEGTLYLAMFPDEVGEVIAGTPTTFQPRGSGAPLRVVTLNMSLEDWTRFLRQTDLLEREILSQASDGTLVKAIARKSQRQIAQGVSWAVYRRDKFICRYCATDDVPLTVDHLVLWEEGGPSIEANLVSSCRRCNKTRGNAQYAAWLEHPYYKKVSKNIDPATHRANQALVGTLGSIPRQVHRSSHR